jgi:hypothetical protein
LSSKPGGPTPATAQVRFGAGIEDVIILPLVLIALAAKKLFHVTLSILIHVLDYAFPIFLQLVRFPLFTVRIIGDGVTTLLKCVVGWLPVSGATREEWRELVSRRWSWLRQKISYKAFEEAVHHAFEGGMAWVFRTCRTLTPGGALLVIAGAILWLPVSFGTATAMHAILIAKAASLPPWMQLLHPLATIIAKSKLLVLPAYPAAWPQAKKHPLVQAIFQFYRYVTALHLMQKAGYRYRQTERAAAETTVVLGRAASLVGLSYWSNSLFAGFNVLAAGIGKASRAAMTRTVEGVSRLPLMSSILGSIVRSYSAHYDGAGPPHAERFSERVRGFFGRWSIKVSADYYEAKEKAEAAKARTGAQAETHPSSAAGRPDTGA